MRQHGERRSRVGGHSTASVSLGIAEHFGADLFMNEALDQPPDNALRFTMPHSNPKVASTGTEATAVAAPLPIRLLSDMSAATVGGDGSSQSVPFERSCSFAPAQSSMLKRSAVARRHEPAWGPLIKARNGPHAPSGRTVRSVMQAFPVLTSQADRLLYKTWTTSSTTTTSNEYSKPNEHLPSLPRHRPPPALRLSISQAISMYLVLVFATLMLAH